MKIIKWVLAAGVIIATASMSHAACLARNPRTGQIVQFPASACMHVYGRPNSDIYGRNPGSAYNQRRATAAGTVSSSTIGCIAARHIHPLPVFRVNALV
jgi:hypothetical protein